MPHLFPLELFAPACLAAGVLLLVVTLAHHGQWRVRIVVVTCLMALAARYLAWRFSHTLPLAEWRLGSLYAWGFFVLECASYASAFITYMIAVRRSDLSSEADTHARALSAETNLPSVDVLIPTLNESRDILERTIVCATGLDYRAKTIYVLDDGKRDWLRELCTEHGVQYIARAENTHAKAGNLNHGLNVSRQQSNGELILVLDADFAPRRDFLLRTVGFFNDSKLGILQTPQVFFNPDPIQFNYSAVGTMPDEQRLLFSTLLPAKDAWGVATCCGTSSLTRRAALEAIGGVPTECVTEDMLLSYRLYEKGFVTRYLNEPLSVGLAPEGIKEYLTQRSRWCLGTIQQAFLHTGPLGRNGLTWKHRIEFLATLLFWCASLPFLLAGILAPIIFGFTGLTVIQTGLGGYLEHFLPLLVAQLIALPWLLRVRHLPVVHDAPNLIVSLSVTPLILKALWRPFGRRFVVTDKGGDRSAVRIYWPIIRVLSILFILLVVAMSLSFDADTRVRYGGDSSRGLIIMLLWGVHGMITLGLAALLCIEPPRPRHDERVILNESAMLISHGRRIACSISDLSMSGARLVLNDKSAIGESLQIEIAGVGSIGCVQTRETRNGICVQFQSVAEMRPALIRKLFGGNLRTAAMTPQTLCESHQVAACVLKRIAAAI